MTRIPRRHVQSPVSIVRFDRQREREKPQSVQIERVRASGGGATPDPSARIVFERGSEVGPREKSCGNHAYDGVQWRIRRFPPICGCWLRRLAATRFQAHRSREFVVMGANHAGERKRKKAKNTRKIEETKARKAAQTAGK